MNNILLNRRTNVRAALTGLLSAMAWLMQSGVAAAYLVPISQTKGWIVEDDWIWACPYDESGCVILSSGWSNATSMAFDGTATLHVIQGGLLYKADPTNGDPTPLGTTQQWQGPTWMAWNSSQHALYVVQNDHLQRLSNPYVNDSYTVLGGAIWNGTQAMTSYGSSLYIIRNGSLYKVNPATGSRSILGTAGDWVGTEAMTSLGVSNPGLFVVQNSRLHSVNPSTGAWSVLGKPEWAGTTSIFGYTSQGFIPGGSLGILHNLYLHTVNPNSGSWTVDSPEWASVSAGHQSPP